MPIPKNKKQKFGEISTKIAKIKTKCHTQPTHHAKPTFRK
jgi:hypothetical protein